MLPNWLYTQQVLPVDLASQVACAGSPPGDGLVTEIVNLLAPVRSWEQTATDPLLTDQPWTDAVAATLRGDWSIFERFTR